MNSNEEKPHLVLVSNMRTTSATSNSAGKNVTRLHALNNRVAIKLLRLSLPRAGQESSRLISKDSTATDHGHENFVPGERIVGHSSGIEVVLVENEEISELAGLERSDAGGAVQVGGSGSSHSPERGLARKRRLLIETADELGTKASVGVLVLGVTGTGDADGESEEGVERVNGPVRTVCDEGASVVEETGGLGDGQAVGSEDEGVVAGPVGGLLGPLV